MRFYQDMSPDMLLVVLEDCVSRTGAGTGQQTLQVLPVEGTFFVVELLDAIARRGDQVPRSLRFKGKDNTGAGMTDDGLSCRTLLCVSCSAASAQFCDGCGCGGCGCGCGCGYGVLSMSLQLTVARTPLCC